jgi:hypothetical protein
MVKHRLVLSGWTIKRSGDAVCGLHRARRRGTQVSWFNLKTKVDSLSRFGLKTVATVFLGLASKPMAMVLVV